MDKRYEWIVVGGGIAGIAIAEILTREGHSVLLLERDERLAGGVTGVCHEWVHTGSLYTLIGKLVTMKYVLGAIDDLLDYYACFPRMNLVPTERGLIVGGDGWFESNYIHFKYRRRPLNPAWTLVAARSMHLIERIANHDWLRRRAGVLEELRAGRAEGIARNARKVLGGRGRFVTVRSTDFTARSRSLLADLMATAVAGGLDMRLGCPVREIKESAEHCQVVTDQGIFKCQQVVLCTGKHVADFVNARVTNSYAPMAVVRGLSADAYSFVELDYHVRNCINLLVKGGGLGLIGGISLKDETQCAAYLDDVIERHRAYQPKLEVLGTYVGVKSEMTTGREDRNYLFHILCPRLRVWAAIPGKFTLGFSLAPEFYRRAYRRNPRKFFQPAADTGEAAALIADTRWQAVTEEWQRRSQGAAAAGSVPQEPVETTIEPVA
ncbi:MAG: FAD-binding oxidoreductase [Gammaproteobacteria bacterium]|nr:FAD-binding oxidoreductase [Gammaproteobacteria bacterium]NIR85759.1 FAD-binding oxidoreductase [Gammaproteobacteria bacterium]NIR90292.1 FAD-binding oxidoreductase [Gammaproteobacteria bacterium]NIU06893.1 FAD-binding oxidoreductase [Gammaproteobacteria bacterium]NIV53826.1 FAD-dependent oxidoreductase [Gammaproteobacteria bacterium]